MTDLSLHRLPPIAPGVVMTVVIPARNEEAEIQETLHALAGQRMAPPFDVVVLANNCTDRTVERAVALSKAFPDGSLRVCVESLAPDVAHVGTARKMLMDRCSARFNEAGIGQGIVATTDADTTVADDWVAETFEEMKRVDAVAGWVEIRNRDRSLMSAAMRDLYARELYYRHRCSDLEALIEPIPEDPPPRHSTFVGASFAVSARAYARAGGLPPISALEDREFLRSLRRIDARVRHSLRVRAWTSGRTRSRVVGGFATFINHLHDRAPNHGYYDVTDPRDDVREATCRAALRRIWLGSASFADATTISQLLGIASERYLPFVEECPTFGTFFERAIAIAPPVRLRPMIPLDDAIAAIEREIVDRVTRFRGNSTA